MGFDARCQRTYRGRAPAKMKKKTTLKFIALRNKVGERNPVVANKKVVSNRDARWWMRHNNAPCHDPRLVQTVQT